MVEAFKYTKTGAGMMDIGQKDRGMAWEGKSISMEMSTLVSIMKAYSTAEEI